MKHEANMKGNEGNMRHFFLDIQKNIPDKKKYSRESSFGGFPLVL